MSHDIELRVPLQDDADMPSASAPQSDDPTPMSRTEAWMLYSSHALSTWNARSYEYAAIIFTAQAFPGTLFYSSLRGLVTTIAVLLLSSAIGLFIDQLSSRRSGLNVTIIVNRTTVLLCCVLWLGLVSISGETKSSWSFSYQLESITQRHIVFASLILLGIAERLSGIANMLTMERDWVPAVADTGPTRGPNAYTLTVLNAKMRRIDLICKLFAPLVISAIIEGFSTSTSVLFLALCNVMGLVVEPRLAYFVWSRNKKLQAPKIASSTTSPTVPDNATPLWRIDRHMRRLLFAQYRQCRTYFRTTVWLPSFSLALLYFSALSYSATFVTWLLNSGFTLLTITIARTVGSVVEVSSTFVAPYGIDKLACTKEGRPTNSFNYSEDAEGLLYDRSHENEHVTGLARTGLWSVSLQLACLIPVVLSIISISYPPAPANDIDSSTLKFVLRSLPGPSLLTACILFTFLGISRLGLWTFDLCVQELDQTLVPLGQQAAFAGTETAFASLFELGQWMLVAVLSSPDQFVWVAISGLAAVALSAVMYAGWHLRTRGHLVHWDKISRLCYKT